jgi:hypothetical protein
MYTYTLDSNMFGYTLIRSDGANIPSDFGNSDFQEFIRWLQAGNALPGLPSATL